MFGWDYPPGAEHDPNAPWNQSEEEEPDLSNDDEMGPYHDDESEID